MGAFYGMQYGIIFFIMFHMARCELYPSIQWSYLNPLFSKNRTQCVLPLSRLFFVCPNTVTILTRLQSSYSSPQYENLWLVSKQGYERCEVNKSMDRRLINCDKPLKLNYYEVIFQRFSADISAPLFEPGKDYYFIATSDGTKSSVEKSSGGHCRTHNMKLKFHVCANNSDALCQSEELCNGIVPTLAPTTASTTMPTTTSSTTMPTTTAAVTTHHTVKNTSTQYIIPTTTPANPANESDTIFKETRYLIVIGSLVFVCVLFLIVFVILILRGNWKRKGKARPSSLNSASSAVCPDGACHERFPLSGDKSAV